MDATFLAAQGLGSTLEDLTPALLVGSLACCPRSVRGGAAVRLSVKSGLPSLLLYLGIGLALGEAGLGIQFDYASITQVLGYAALVLILAEGGLTTSWRASMASSWPRPRAGDRGRRGLGGRGRRGLPLPAGPAVDDRAADRRDPQLDRRGSGLLRAAQRPSPDGSPACSRPSPASTTRPSSSSSPRWPPPAPTRAQAEPWWVLSLARRRRARRRPWSGWRSAGSAASSCAGPASGSSGLFSIGVLALTVLAYAAAVSVHASGFIACYLAALVLGNMGLPNRRL